MKGGIVPVSMLKLRPSNASSFRLAILEETVPLSMLKPRSRKESLVNVLRSGIVRVNWLKLRPRSANSTR